MVPPVTCLSQRSAFQWLGLPSTLGCLGRPPRRGWGGSLPEPWDPAYLRASLYATAFPAPRSLDTSPQNPASG